MRGLRKIYKGYPFFILRSMKEKQTLNGPQTLISNGSSVPLAINKLNILNLKKSYLTLKLFLSEADTHFTMALKQPVHYQLIHFTNII